MLFNVFFTGQKYMHSEILTMQMVYCDIDVITLFPICHFFTCGLEDKSVYLGYDLYLNNHYISY